MSEPINGDELLARIKPQLRTVKTQICLQPDLLEAWEDAAEELAAAEDAAGAGRLAGASAKAPKAAQKKLDDIEAKIDEVSPWFTFRAMPTEEYQALTAKHPPREDDQIDLFAGHNRDAVVAVLVRECLVDPVFSDEGYKALLASCAPSQWAAMRDAALEVNGGAVKPPKSRRESPRLSVPASDSE